jgi:hypothetical protein
MRLGRVLMMSKFVVATGLLCALAQRGGLLTTWRDWRAAYAIEEARAEDRRLQELQRQAEAEPRLAPVFSTAQASVEARRQRLALEANELAFEGARARFEEATRQAAAGQALVDSAADLLPEANRALTRAD